MTACVIIPINCHPTYLTFLFNLLRIFILNKLKRTPNLNGVIFFTIDQFCYGEKFNTELMLNIVKIGLSIHFARENISVLNLKDLKTKYVEFISYYHCKKSEQNFVNEYHFL